MKPNLNPGASAPPITISNASAPALGSDRDTLSDVCVSSILRPPIIVTRDLPLSELAAVLGEQCLETRDALVIVIDEHDEPLGLINAAQIMRLSSMNSRESLLDLCAEDGVTQACLVVPDDATLKWVARLLVDSGEAAAVVVDPLGKPSGTVSAVEVLRGLGYQN